MFAYLARCPCSAAEGPDGDVICAPSSSLLHASAEAASSSFLSNGHSSGSQHQQQQESASGNGGSRGGAGKRPPSRAGDSFSNAVAVGSSRESGGSSNTGFKIQPASHSSGKGRARNQGGAVLSQSESPQASQSLLHTLRFAYLQLWGVTRLPAVWKLTAFLLTSRLGILAAEGAASLKLIDKGVSKEALATLVLLQFPVELVTALAAGRWAARASPARPFLVGYGLRLVAAAATVALVAVFPEGAASMSEHPLHFAALAALSLATSCFSTLCFTALGSFFNSISDPDMGGAYLTLLNTITNMGYMLPRSPVFALMDVLTSSR